MLRILYVTYSLEPAGAERLIYALATNLDRGRYQPVVCALKRGGELVAELERKETKVYVLNKKRTFDLRTLEALRRILQDEAVDIIHTHNFPANFWGRLAARSANSCRVIATEHSLSIRKGWIRRKIDRVLARCTDRIIAVSDAVRQSLILDERISPNKIVTIYNGIGLDQFDNLRSPQSVREELKIHADAPVVGIVGRLIEDKGHRNFIEAAQAVLQKVHGVTFLVVGDGQLQADLKALVRKSGLQGSVLFTGFRKDRLDLMNIFTIAVLSSVREGLPVTLLEYMALKKATIVTDVGGMPEVIQNGVNGWVVPQRNTGAIASKILELLEDEKLRTRFGANAYKRILSDFSEATMVRKTQLLYEEVAGLNGGVN